jgi:serine/threonine-protein kinase SRPK3
MKTQTVLVTAETVKGIYNEQIIMDKLATDKTHPGYRHCPSLICHEIVETSHGPHLADLLGVCGTTLEELSLERAHHAFPPRIVARIIKELLLALTYVHDTCGVIHGGEHPSK